MQLFATPPPLGRMFLLVILSVLGFIALFLAGCTARILPDRTIPHQTAERLTVDVWIRGDDGKMHRNAVDFLPGVWIFENLGHQ